MKNLKVERAEAQTVADEFLKQRIDTIKEFNAWTKSFQATKAKYLLKAGEYLSKHELHAGRVKEFDQQINKIEEEIRNIQRKAAEVI